MQLDNVVTVRHSRNNFLNDTPVCKKVQIPIGKQNEDKTKFPTREKSKPNKMRLDVNEPTTRRLARKSIKPPAFLEAPTRKISTEVTSEHIVQ